MTAAHLHPNSIAAARKRLDNARATAALAGLVLERLADGSYTLASEVRPTVLLDDLGAVEHWLDVFTNGGRHHGPRP